MAYRRLANAARSVQAQKALTEPTLDRLNQTAFHIFPIGIQANGEKNFVSRLLKGRWPIPPRCLRSFLFHFQYKKPFFSLPQLAIPTIIVRSSSFYVRFEFASNCFPLIYDFTFTLVSRVYTCAYMCIYITKKKNYNLLRNFEVFFYRLQFNLIIGILLQESKLCSNSNSINSTKILELLSTHIYIYIKYRKMINEAKT